MTATATAWLTAARDAVAAGTPAMLVTVVTLKGSSPRASGTRMVVTETAIAGSIGGGGLEHAAIKAARARLADPTARPVTVEATVLGPHLGQCCGGRVLVAHERLDAGAKTWIARWSAAVEGETVVTEIAADRVIRHFLADDAATSRPAAEVARLAADPTPEGATVWRADDGVHYLIENAAPRPHRLYLFGAGHVGRALVEVLAPLPFAVAWIDDRAALLRPPFPANATPCLTAEPAAVVDAAERGAMYLAMTPNHGLDFAICERVLSRGDFAFLGMVGSDGKRRALVKRMRARGLDNAVIDRLVCPIGLAGIPGKSPAEIAVATAAQLLMTAAAETDRTRSVA